MYHKIYFNGNENGNGLLSILMYLSHYQNNVLYSKVEPTPIKIKFKDVSSKELRSILNILDYPYVILPVEFHAS